MSFITSNPGQKRVLIYCYERRKSSVPVALVFVVFGNESNQLSQAAILNQQNTNFDVILYRSCASVLQCAEGHGVTLTHPHRSSSLPFLHQSTEHEFRRYFVPKLCISSTVRWGSRRYADPSSPVVEFTLPAPVNRTRIWTLFLFRSVHQFYSALRVTALRWPILTGRRAHPSCSSQQDTNLRQPARWPILTGRRAHPSCSSQQDTNLRQPAVQLVLVCHLPVTYQLAYGPLPMQCRISCKVH